ncbi:hypothetical protein V8F06_002700 [Rhypophila decipiens]
MAGSGPSGTDSQPEWRVSRSKNDRGQYKLEKKTPEEIAKRKRLAAERKADGKSSKKERSSRNSSAADEPRSNSSSSYACGPWKAVSSSSTRKSADSESSHRSSKTSKSSHKKGYAESTTLDASSEMPSQPPRYPVSTEPATNGYYGSPPQVQPMRQFNSPAQHQPNFYTPPEHEAYPEPGGSHHQQQFPPQNANRAPAPFHNPHNTDQGATSYDRNFGAFEQSRTATGTRAGNDPSYHHQPRRTDQSHGQQSDSFGRHQPQRPTYETNHNESKLEPNASQESVPRYTKITSYHLPTRLQYVARSTDSSSTSSTNNNPPKTAMQGQEPRAEPTATSAIPQEASHESISSQKLAPFGPLSDPRMHVDYIYGPREMELLVLQQKQKDDLLYGPARSEDGGY